MSINLALPWYRRQDWSALHALFVEREYLPSNYDLWKQRALRAERRYAKKGYRVIRVTITPQDLEVWCASNRRTNTLNARYEFAQEKMTAG